jgi:amino acid adenylation domain-containing protein
MTTTLLQNYVTARAQRRPEAVAVVSDEAMLTYGDLEARSNQLARLLRENGCKHGDRVCVLNPKSAASIVAILAIYKADCIYVPLDPASPAPRLSKMIDSADPCWILAGGPVAPLLEELFKSEAVRYRTRIGWLEPWQAVGHHFLSSFDARDLDRYSMEVPTCRSLTDNPAHLLFTSGSTGTPKGVPITHRNVIEFIEWAVKYFGIVETDRHSGHPPLHFDLSMFDIFGTLAAGASLYLVPPDLSLFPNKTADFIRKHELTQWFSVPSLLTYMANLDVVRSNDFPSLARLLWCGEVLSTSSLIYWMSRLPHVSFTNLYGPTETTIASSYYTVPQCPATDSEPIPIGYPCAGETLHVLDADLRKVPQGEIGDLYIGGVGLSPGYWRNPEATRAAFIRNPFSADDSERLYRTGDLASIGLEGEIYFRGRADSQIKCRGHRVELGEIEAVLDTFTNIQGCAVVAIPAVRFDGHTICCAYVPAPDRIVTPAMLRTELLTKLPAYMVPTEWLEFSTLPKNANGKVDRPFLKNEFQNRSANLVRQPANDNKNIPETPAPRTIRPSEHHD